MTTVAWVAFWFAAFPALLYLRNTYLFRPPAPAGDATSPPISVLIPARNEEGSIRAAVESVLASRGVELECVVLDDHSEDRTAEIVRELTATDARVRLEPAPPLPTGWSGKQHACHVLAKLARHRLLAFLDADVRLAPDALARMTRFLHDSKAGLVSGFPRQETGTFLEKLVIPLIHFLLLSYLPIGWMRRSSAPGFGAGCGQWFLTTREDYEKAGTHAAVKHSFHDGIKLPRAYRAKRIMTDICDATELAACRMYRSASEVWNGLVKNAREGLAAPTLLLPWTVLLFCGHVLPFALLPCALGGLAGDGSPYPDGPPPGAEELTRPRTTAAVVTLAAGALSLYPRLDAAIRFRQSWLGALLHPLGILALLGIQWYATWRWLVGRPVSWKGRLKPGHTSNSSASA